MFTLQSISPMDVSFFSLHRCILWLPSSSSYHGHDDNDDVDGLLVDVSLSFLSIKKTNHQLWHTKSGRKVFFICCYFLSIIIARFFGSIFFSLAGKPITTKHHLLFNINNKWCCCCFWCDDHWKLNNNRKKCHGYRWFFLVYIIVFVSICTCVCLCKKIVQKNIT